MSLHIIIIIIIIIVIIVVLLLLIIHPCEVLFLGATLTFRRSERSLETGV